MGRVELSCRRPIRLSLTFVSFLFSACALPPAKVSVPPVPQSVVGTTQTGIASWYGPGFHGRPTASGVIYDQHELTAAHQTLPLGTRVMVTHMDNGKSVEVTINDRGPFAKGRIIDLSYAAAEALGMVGPGTIPVRLEILGPNKFQPIRSSLDYTLQAGSFAELQNAQQLFDQLAGIYPDRSQVSIVPFYARESMYFRVQIGTFGDRAEAEDQARQLARRGFPVMIVEK